jgi:Na+-transporting methylmalonyl-CoA/oxaloacetate decarboxylase gamma subunit
LTKHQIKRHGTALLILIGISVLTIFPYFFKDSVFIQDDFLFHRTRLESYFQAVKQLDFFPRIFPNMGLYFGYAADLFYPSILLLPFALFRLFGVSFVSSYYLYQLLISFATAVSAYYFLYSIKRTQKIALLFSCFYTLSTYRLIDQSVRAALGETLAFIFLPLLVLAVYSIFYTEKQRWQLLAISMSLLIASHLITAFYTVVFLVLFILLHWKKCKQAQVKSMIKAGFLTIGLSAWFLFPYLEQTAHLTFNFDKTDLWASGLNFSLADLFTNSLANVSAPFSNLKPNIGLVLFAATLIAGFYYPKLTKTNKHLWLVTLFFLILTTNIFPWAILKNSIFAIIQFPWRLLLFASFFASLLAAVLIEQFSLLTNKTMALAISFCALVTVGFNVNNSWQSTSEKSMTITNKNVNDFYESEIGHGKEYLVKDTDFKTFFAAPTMIIDDVSYPDSANQTINKYQYSQYSVRINGVQEVQLPKFYYKGYEVLDNQRKINNYNKNGLVTVRLSQGSHVLRISYKKTIIQKSATFFSLLLTGFLCLKAVLKKRN